MEKVSDPAAPAGSFAVTVTVAMPVAVGVPVIRPVLEPMVRPAGSPLADQVRFLPAESSPCMATNAGLFTSRSWVPGSMTVTVLPDDESVNAAVPSGVPRPVGPSYPFPALHRYCRVGSQLPLEPEVTSLRSAACPLWYR